MLLIDNNIVKSLWVTFSRDSRPNDADFQIVNFHLAHRYSLTSALPRYCLTKAPRRLCQLRLLRIGFGVKSHNAAHIQVV